MVLKKIFLYFFLIIFLIPSSLAKEIIDVMSPSCYDLKKIDHFLKPVSAEVKIYKFRSFVKNTLNARRSISDIHKKRYGADINFKFDEKKSCNFSSKVRLHGDGMDHIDITKLTEGEFFVSLDVKLKEGNILNNTRYKLFLPRVRNGDNEIIATALLKELGFLSPRTFYIDLEISDKKRKFLMQEVLNKEFIENNDFPEGIIIEGNENYEINKSSSDLLFTRIDNKNYITKSYNSEILDFVGKINLIYLKDRILKDKFNLNEDLLYLDYDLIESNFNSYSRKLIREFNAINLALNGGHGLSRQDSRFYYDKLNNSLIPIYYDGGIDIINNSKNLSLSELNRSNYISQDLIMGAEIIKKKLNQNINLDSLYTSIIKNGASLNREQFNETIKSININLNKIINTNIKSLDFNFVLNLPDYYFKKFKLIFIKGDNLVICKKINECKNFDKSNKKMGDIINSNQKYLFTGFNISFLKNKLSENINEKWTQLKTAENNLISYNQEVNIKFDLDKKILNFFFNDNGRVKFSGSEYSGWLIQGFSENIKSFQEHAKFTGCFTFVDTKIRNTKINFINSYCEDAINFIRVKGDVEINTSNSISDAVDADFSNITFNNVKIKNAKNDCLDLSYGNYKVSKSEFISCGDKGISAGEKSKVFLDDINLIDTKIAIASKDDAVVNLKNFSYSGNNKICFAAYRKKQEFNGGQINYYKSSNDINCKNNYIQEGSNLKIINVQ